MALPDSYGSTKASHINVDACEVEAERQPKPDRLMESMYQMDGIKHRLQGLVNKIRDGSCPQAPELSTGGTNATEVTMSHVLNEGPEYMNKICEEMHSAIAQIECELW